MTEGVADGIQRPLASFSPVQLQDRSGEMGKSFWLPAFRCPSPTHWEASDSATVTNMSGSPEAVVRRTKTVLPASALIHFKQL